MKRRLFLLLTASLPAADWVLETTAPWQARDSQVEFVLNDQLWIGGGWSKEKDNFDDVWHSANGRDGQRLETKTI
jgi:hypothetical protein